jgi:non-ribosomal peptide synthetase component F
MVCADSDDLQHILKWNQHCPGLVDACIHDLVHDKALAHPEAIALFSWDRQITYAELDRLSDGVAALLRRRGLPSGALVPLCIHKSALMVVSILGVLKAGGAYVPLDPEQPEAQRLSVIKQTAARHIVTCLTAAHLFETVENVETVYITYESIESELAAGTSVDFELIKPEQSAIVLFTSGSTGAPRGVIIEHR